MVLMTGLFLLQTAAAQGGWRPTIDNPTNFPTVISRAERPAALARLDAILPIVQAALTTEHVEFQVSRSFGANPWVPGWPLPRLLLVQGYEWDDRTGDWEGEAATSIRVFANDLDPLLSIAIDNPRTFVLRNQNVLFLRKDDRVPWHPVSQREFVRRMRVELTRRARHDRTAQAELARLEADAAQATDAPMLLPAQHQQSTWPGWRRPGVRQVVELDSSFYRGKPHDALVFFVVITGVHNASRRPIALNRIRAFRRQLDREALRRLLE